MGNAGLSIMFALVLVLIFSLVTAVPALAQMMNCRLYIGQWNYTVGFEFITGGFVKMKTYFTIAQMILSVALTAALLLKVKGGGLGGIFGQADTVYRTRRGVEKTLFQVTIVMVVLFIAVSLIMLKIQ